MSRRQVRRWVYRLAALMALALMMLNCGAVLMAGGQLGASLYVLAGAGLIALAALIGLFVLMFRVAGREYDE